MAVPTVLVHAVGNASRIRAEDPRRESAVPLEWSDDPLAHKAGKQASLPSSRCRRTSRGKTAGNHIMAHMHTSYYMKVAERK